MFRKRFKNPWPHEQHGVLDILKWKLGSNPSPQSGLPPGSDHPPACKRILRTDLLEPFAGSWRIVWLGHASFLVQGFGCSVLIDPIFSDYCAPLPIPALRRKSPPPLAIDDLPPVDAVLITHSHYDHLDLPTLRKMPASSLIVTAEGHSRWLGKKLSRSVSELPWHGELSLNGKIRIISTPAQHFSGRTPFDRDRGHWCGWLLEAGNSKIWHAGDSGYCPAFLELGRRYGPIDFGMIPIGAYDPRSIMKPVHMNPEEAVRAFMDARCERAVGMHWGTFALTDEPVGEPPLRLRAETQRLDLPPSAFTTGDIGGIWEI